NSFPDLSFDLTFFSANGPAKDGIVFTRRYTLAGPQQGTTLLPGMRVVGDNSGRYYYAAHPHVAVKIDAQTGVANEVNLGSSLPELSWPMGMAFDSARNRVLLVSLGGEGFLYGYAPDQDRWSVVSSMNNYDLGNLVYHANQDALYGIGAFGSRVIERFTPEGVHQGQIHLPGLPTNVGISGYHSELVSVGDYLVMLIGPDPAQGPFGLAQQWWMYLIDPRSGQVRQTWHQAHTPANQPPSVTVTKPASGSHSPWNTSVQLVAQVHDSDGTVQSVEFFADNRSLGTGSPLANGTSFVLNWSNPGPGPHKIQALATDDDGAITVSAPVLLPAGVAPTISQQPASRTNYVGQTAFFKVEAVGTAPLTYSWQHNGTAVPGATNAMLILSNVQLSDAGSYCANVSNPIGTIKSAVATLQVLPQLASELVDMGFHPIVTSGEYSVGVEAIALQPDNKILIGGLFDKVNEAVRLRLARLLPNGALDQSFNWPLDQFYPNSLVVQPDGKILVGGAGIDQQGLQGGLVRLNSDGSIDSGFHFYAASTNYVPVRSLALQPDGKILVSYMTCCGEYGNGSLLVDRLNSDGSCDQSFQQFVLDQIDDDDVNSIALQSDGKIILGGYLLAHDKPFPPNLIRLNSDGSVDTSFQPQVNSTVQSVLVQPDGKILIAGWFDEVDGIKNNGVARLNSDGSLDTSFHCLPWPEERANVTTMALQGDGRVLIGGTRYTQEMYLDQRFVTRLDAQGNLDPNFQVKFANESLRPYLGRIETLVIQADGQVLVGGQFGAANGVPRTHIAR
ncbi:MAG TPA: Ig-like domain-containing protein, partial [Clostridia bacterium]|nr:Ig-like domain-containing protein [Clostridia bacterium]